MQSYVDKVLLGVVLLFFVTGTAVGATLDYPTLQSAVVKIRATKQSDPGAGTLIKIDGRRGYILTAYHVIQAAVDLGSRTVEVEFHQKIGSFDGVIVSEWTALKNDLAMIVVENIPVQSPLRFGDLMELKIQDSVIAIGHPSGSSWPVTDGRVSNFANGDILFSGLAVDRGSSGGPLLNERGEMIGLIIEKQGVFGRAIRMDVIKPIIGVWIGKLPQEPKNPRSEPVTDPPPVRNTLTNTIGIEFVRVQAGEFMMGSKEGDRVELPIRRVRIARPFYLSKYEVTQRQWEAVLGGNPSYFKGDPNRPVEQVSWRDVKDFIRKLNDKEGTKRYRLPTEAEWEFAARSGGKNERWSGTSREPELKEFGWYVSNSNNKTQKVGGKKPNGLGLYDMSGNVWEWIEDCGHGNYQGAPTDGSAWLEAGGGECGLRVARGGSWLNVPVNLRSSFRGRFDAVTRGGIVGFRLAQDLE